MKIFCGLLASGRGERYSNTGQPKQLLPLAGSALFTETLQIILKSKLMDNIAIAVLPELEQTFTDEITDKFTPDEIRKITTLHGGKTRIDSITNIFNHFKKNYLINKDDIFLLVDANRPLVSYVLYKRVIEEAVVHRVSCPARPLVDGVASVENGFIKNIPNKSTLHSIQTPEACNFLDLNELFEKGVHLDYFGICEMFQSVGIHPKIVTSDITTHKITYQGDLEIIETIMKFKKNHGL